MKQPGNKWNPGKKPGTWFRHISILGPCLAENERITLLRHKISVPAGDKWSLAAIAALPSETVRVQGTVKGQNIDGVLKIPLAAKRRVIWHKDGALTGQFQVTPAGDTEVTTLAITGTWKDDGMEAVLFGPI
jgi:hypothetical protein